MTSSLILCSILAFAAQAPSQSLDPQPAESRLDRVTVYSGQALVERVFEFQSTSTGPVRVLVSPLPMSAAIDSFQTRVEGGNVVVQGLELRERTGELDEGARQSLRDQLEAVQRQRRVLESEAKAITASRGVLDAVISSLASGGLARFEGMSLAEVMEYVDQQSAALDRRAAAREESERQLLARQEDLDKQLGGRRSNVQPYREAHISLFFQQPGTATVRVLYTTYGASWEPAYDVRVDPSLENISVGLIGRVQQSTGEDWVDARVLLSTSQPQLGLDPPSLPARWGQILSKGGRISTAESQRLHALGYVDKEADSSGAYAATARGFSADDAMSVAAPTVSVQDYGLSQQFALPDRVTLNSGDDLRQFKLADLPLEVRPERYVVPSLSELCYLRAEVTSESDAPLLPGPAQIYLGPDFLGESSFPLLRQGDSTMLNLGLDPNLTFEFRKVTDDRESPGLFSSTIRRVRLFESEFKLSAASRGPIELYIEEVLPVSQDERLKIEAYRMHPGALESEEDLLARKERGVWRWRVNLDPGAKLKMRWGYEFRHNEKYIPHIDE